MATTSEYSVFTEHKIVFQKIDVLTEQQQQQDCSADEMDEALIHIRSLFDKYLELPSLLDQHVERMVQKLTIAARTLMDDQVTLRQSFWSSGLSHQLSILYALSKVRGRKRIQKFLPHRVEDVHAILYTLLLVHELSQEKQNVTSLDSASTGKPQIWESLYMLWDWMAMLSLIPFRSTVMMEQKEIHNLLNLSYQYLGEASSTREMAAVNLASWLSRQDMEDHLKAFRIYADEQLRLFLEHAENTFLVLGILQTLVTVIKHSKAERGHLLKMMAPLQDTMQRMSKTEPNNLLIRKYIVKWWTRIATLFMPPRIATWRYRRGRRSLKENLQMSDEYTNILQEPSFQNDSSDEHASYNYALFLVPDEVESAIGEVILGLKDSSTNVRWSAAKGIGRITERLPAICSEDVLDALLYLFHDREKDNDWQGACLAMAELARRGLLLPHRLSDVVPKIIEAMHFDVPRRQTSVGTHVRDAACYTCWAIARTYSAQVLRPFVAVLTQSVVTAFLFDREVNGRRAASAAFQEFVGRQGATNVPNGIDILTKADFFSLGNRADAYLTIAPQIAKLDHYRRAIIDHLYLTKLKHWDIGLRKLAAQSLAKMAELDLDHIATIVIPYLLRHSLDESNIQLRHGSVLGLAEILLATSNSDVHDNGFGDILLKGYMDTTLELVPTIEKKRLYRGKGGEHMRLAVCRLIECIAAAKIPLSVPRQVRYLDTIDACISHPNELVQKQATSALSCLMNNYFPVSKNGPSDRLQKRVVDKYVNYVNTSINPAATRGFSMALGKLPAKLLAPSTNILDTCLACLCRMSHPNNIVGTDKDAESRRNALISLGQICATVGIVPSPMDLCVVGLTKQQVTLVFNALFNGLNDYNKERRGDVGSMSRIASMRALISLVDTIMMSPTPNSASWFDDEISQKVVGGLMKQLAEKLDAVRCEAGQCLVALMKAYPVESGCIKNQKDVVQHLGIDSKDASAINWADASVTFPRIVSCLEIDSYFSYIVAGLVISAGCLTQSVAKEAGTALVQWLKSATETKKLRFSMAVLDLFAKHQHEGRVTLPLLKTIITLMNRICIDDSLNSNDFATNLLLLLKREEAPCTDIPRLSAITDVSLGLLGYDKSTCQMDIMEFVCRKLLMHKYPRIRRLAAERFYIKLLEHPCLMGDHDNDDDYADYADYADHPVIDFLLTCPWDSDLPYHEVKQNALNVANSLNIISIN